MLGSRYYVDHPLVPLERTVGVLNMEQIGRTDGDGGIHENSASFTGHDYSTLPQYFVTAGERLGIEVYKHEANSDRYFTASDNGAFARAGIPAHTACTLFSFEEYHQPGDNPERIDYENMARVTRMLALGLFGLSTAEGVPRWNREIERTAPFIEAWQNLTGGTPPPRF
jgi:Zn-dependent M28 family amino/carboxypeptidase